LTHAEKKAREEGRMERMKSERAEKQQKKKAGEIEQRSERQRQKKRKEGRDRGKRTQKRRQDKQVQRNNTNERNTMQIQRALYWKLRKKERRPIKNTQDQQGMIIINNTAPCRTEIGVLGHG